MPQLLEACFFLEQEVTANLTRYAVWAENTSLVFDSSKKGTGDRWS